MPHFSDSDLVAKYGHKEELDFTYHLKQGRPSFAFNSFVEHQIELGGASKKRVSQAQAKACLIALRLFAHQGVASACVAFIEMLGRDSTRLRVDLQTATTIYSFQQREEGWRKQDKQQWQDWLINAERKIAGSMLSAFRKHGKRSSEMLMRLLEAAVSNKLAKSKINSCSIEAAREWDIAVMFCRFHRLPLPDAYLQECAKHDDWLHFIVFAQQHQYPKEHVLELVQLFKSTSLTEHLSLAFENPVYGASFPLKEQQSIAKQLSVTKKKSIVRDNRATYLFKVGFDNSKEGGDDSTDEGEEEDDIDDEYPGGTEHSATQHDDLIVDNVASDLFGVILACQSSPHPAKMLLAYSAIFRQPSLAVLSGSLTNSSPLNCLCTCLMTSMRDEDVATVTGKTMTSLQWHQWNLDELINIVDIAMEARRSLMLCKAFLIFLPDCPLTAFLEFICEFLVKSDESSAAMHLKRFHHTFLEIVECPGSLQEGTTINRPKDINSPEFLEKAVSDLTLLFFKTCRNFAEICRLLKLMSAVNFSGIFSHPVANYAKLYELSMIIKTTSVQLDIGGLLTGDGSMFHRHCQEVLENLQTAKDFTSAKRFAKAAGLNMDHVIVNQLKDELEQMKCNTQWKSETVRELFWQKCNKELKSTRTSNKAAFQFFRSVAGDLSLNLNTCEKISILCLALDWLGKVTASTSATYVSLEQEIWRLRLDLEIENIKSEANGNISLDEVHINKTRSSHDISGSDVKYRGPDEFLYLADCGLTAQQPKQTTVTAALHKIVKDLLANFRIIQAHKVCQQFNHSNQDLAVVLTCIKLARGRQTADELGAEMKILLARGKRKRLSLSESVSSLNRTHSYSSISSFGETEESNETLTCMETLCEHANTGRQCCDRITNCYKVAQILNCSYDEIVKQSSIETLKIILQSNTPQQFSTAKDFIKTTEMKDTDVSSFLADMIIKQVTLKTEQRQQQQGQSTTDSQVPLSRKPSDKEELSQFIRLCQNPATLGNRLIQEAKALLDNPSTSKIAHTLQVELIIRAHDCHTICCNMEGISGVLRLCRDCTQALGRADEHRLMIRLIMGVGRYSEMMYTFEYLHKAKKIEHLIRIGSKDGKLKIALLDYLKRCKPPDPETYNMVSFKFRMHREIGEMLKKDAMKSLKALADRTMETNIELQNCLQEILQGLTEAAQNYAKENCLRHAEHCICQARLVALQLHLLSTDTRVINLDSKEFHKFITKHGKFHEALLVARAYSNRHVKWSNALYYNVIQQGNFVFLDDFKRSLRLEESLFTDISTRYKLDQEKTPEMRDNMQRLISYCNDLKTAYDIATELNLQDIAMEMLKGDGGSYLRDVI